MKTPWRRECRVRVIRAERTFWEKATILHHEAHRPAGNPLPPRYSRHDYDLARMADAPVKDAALADLTLLADVAAFRLPRIGVTLAAVAGWAQ